MGFGPFVNFIKFQKAHRSALVMNIFCCNPKMMKGLIAFQFIAYRGGDKNGNFLNVILLLSLVKLYTVCWGHPRTDMIASLKQSFLAITLSQKKYFIKEFPTYCASLFLSMHSRGGMMTVIQGDIEASDFLNCW